MAYSPTQLTLRKWRDAGYTVEVVEKWNHVTKTRRDLFGILDVVAVGNGETIGIQSTSASNVSARVRKIEDKPETVSTLREAGWRLIVEGWRKPKHRWVCREVDVS